jgi:ketosteroid isomerase-like protein
MSSTDQQIREFGERWVDAETRGDMSTLDGMAADDFTLVGPLGFVLDREQWLARYRTGDLVTKTLVWDEVSVREYGNTAVAVGVHTQQAEFKGSPADGKFRATHILVRRGDGWVLAGIHLSPIGGPPPFTPRS